MTSVQTQDILLRRVEPNALRSLIEYLYTGKLTITSDNVVPLLKAGHRFGCPFVARATGAVLDEICQLQNNNSINQNNLGKRGSIKSSNNHDGINAINSINFTSYSDQLGITTLGDVRPDSIITIDNWLDVYRLSSIYNLTPLRELVKLYIAKDFWKLSQSNYFKEARMQDVLFFANSEGIRASLISMNDQQDVNTQSEAELKIFKAMLSWLLHKSDDRQQYSVKVMNTINFNVIKVSI